MEKAAPTEDDEEATHPKIVVFVDDLDRCMPDKGVQLLESIKLVLAQRGFVFVLAVDRRVIESFLAKRYKEQFGIEEYRAGSSYLDKIVQLPLYLPPYADRFEAYIVELLKRKRFDGQREIANTLTGLAKVLAIGSNANPRTLVRFINNLLVDFRLQELTTGQRPGAAFLQLCAVSRSLQQHLGDTALYRMLAENTSLCEQIAAGARKPIHERLELGKEGTYLWRQHSRLIEELDRHPFLMHLLDSEAGKQWLTDHQARQDVDRVLVIQRDEAASESTARQQRRIVKAAIRRALGLPSNARIPQERLAEVKELDLSGALLDDRGLAYMAKLTAPQSLELWGAQVTDAGLAHLAKLTSLQELSLGETEVTDAGLAHLANLTALESLLLLGTQVTDAGLQHLAKLTALRELYLQYTQVTGAGLAHLANLTALWGVNLCGTKVTDAGLAHLPKPASLRYLGLQSTQVTDAGLAHLANLTALQSLDLDGTKVTDAGLAHLANLTALQSLSVAGTQITDAGLAHLANLTALQRLWLNGTKVTDTGLSHIANLTALRGLYLDETRVTKAGIAKLKAVLPQCIIQR